MILNCEVSLLTLSVSRSQTTFWTADQSLLLDHCSWEPKPPIASAARGALIRQSRSESPWGIILRHTSSHRP
ncbi:hypothetical protein BDV28DRAFT_144580 [Aspergillus coremiiformis]|uniref:Uncharacterized protein n=1 Tax=Aspergillus coremiiformis TaxID=138285 RepID=A0A5N6YUA7_9EURO|nr:hypothetical protein BDV28DRAFT_144580 [Aspergillus coremiiformis]